MKHPILAVATIAFVSALSAPAFAAIPVAAGQLGATASGPVTAVAMKDDAMMKQDMMMKKPHKMHKRSMKKKHMMKHSM